MTRIDRLMAYLVMFQSRSLIRAQDLAQRFEISERTVYRDIDALCQVGVPIYGVAGEGYRLMDGYYLPPVTFSLEEVRALALALSMFRGFAADGVTSKSAENAHDKIRSILPNRQKKEVEVLAAVLNFYAMPQPQINFDDQKLLTLQQAIQNNKLINLTYHSFADNKQTQRVIEPIELAMINHTWLLTAYCRLRGGVRNFNLARMDRYQVLEQSFAPRNLPQSRPPEKEFDITVQFEHEIVRWVHERQHISFVRETASTEDGVVMLYRVPSWRVIETWLLGWGDQMMIVAPRHLRNQVRQMAQRIAARHAD
ncbi:MAG: helix-turn-helix transcriptional regulator [Candidatus Promineifilaceae bacterium]